jgi:peptide subunit release factor 1 (eRF1)
MRDNAALMTGTARLRELAAWRSDGHKVLSLYLNLDPSEFPTPKHRATEFNSLMDTVERAVRHDELIHAQKEELKSDTERVRSWWDNEFDASGTRGVALFVCGAAELFDVHHLARPVRSEVVIDDSPYIEPLTTLPGGDGYCVLLTSRQVARILMGGRDGMREVVKVVDDVHRWHDQGGWSQARYQRGILKEAQDHLKHAGDEVFALFKGGHVQRLIIGAPHELRGEVEQNLHSYLRERIAGWLDIDIRSSPSQVASEAAGVIDADESERERSWLERLKSEVGRNSRGTAGLAATLAALNERRVEGLLVKDGFRAPGYATADASFLSAEPGASPTGEPLQEREDVIESALESALEQSAEIVVIRRHPDIDAVGSIGAVLRY